VDPLLKQGESTYISIAINNPMIPEEANWTNNPHLETLTPIHPNKSKNRSPTLIVEKDDHDTKISLKVI
jgi:hypothetical protein